HRTGPFLFVHGSPRNPLSEYVFPEDIYNHRKMERLFQLIEHYCFQGHTHVPGIFTENFQFFAPEEIDHEYTLGEGKVMGNVGSVGQPRENAPGACYVVLDDGLSESDKGQGESPAAKGADAADTGEFEVKPAQTVRLVYRRLPYDFETTIRKIYDVPD